MSLSSLVGGQVLNAGAALIKYRVIARWSRYRADRFLEALMEAVRFEMGHGVSEEEPNDVLNRMMAKEANTEAVFEAYRRVCLSRSRDIGPRMVGMMTATLLLEERRPTAVEDSIFDVAENFSDSELLDVVDVVRGWQKSERDGYKDIASVGGTIQHTIESTWIDDRSSKGIDGSSQLISILGPWGEKLRSYGLVREVVHERRKHYREDSERHIDQDMSGRLVSRTIVFVAGYADLIDFIERAERAVDSVGETG